MDGHPPSSIASLAPLTRSWWFTPIPGLRAGSGTYERYPLDQQPELSEVDGELTWLDEVDEWDEWSIDTSDGAQLQALTLESLESLVEGVRLPSSLRTFARRPDLQRRVRSCTACYLDLGDFAAPTDLGGYLIHLLSDQQWVRHWLIYVDDSGAQSMVTSPEPIGFDLPSDWETPLPAIIPLDGSLEIEVCADSFDEFLHRFWIENEIWFALDQGKDLPPRLGTYAAQLSPDLQ